MVQRIHSADAARRRKLWMKLALIAVVMTAIYLLRPKLEAWPSSQKTVADPSAATGTEVNAAPETGHNGNPPNQLPKIEWKTEDQSSSEASADISARRQAAETDDMLVFDPAGNSKPENSRPETSENSSPESAGDPVLGQLTEVGNNVFESTAGLIYRSGSQDGHRLDHVMQHAKDDRTKKIHGVFDGDRDQILSLIDEAFQKATKGDTDVRGEQQNGRHIYTVNLRRRIGQVGGEDGKRQGNPECRYLRLVLENDNEVISAYPTRTF